MTQKQSTITTEQLLENGWIKENEPGLFLASKCISIDQDEDEGTIDMVLHSTSGDVIFAVCMPDGSLLNINPSSIEELNFFENMILGYMPNY